MGRGLGGERYTSLSPCLLIKMICGDPFSLHSSLLPQLPHSCYWGATVCELLVSVFSQGPQPATDSLTAVSGTFTLEVLWQTNCARQAFQWKCSTQPFATAFLIHYLLTLFSEWTLAFPPLDVTPNWVWQKLKFLRLAELESLIPHFLLLLVCWLFVVVSPGVSGAIKLHGFITTALMQW